MNRFFPWLGYLPLLDADTGSSGDAGQGENPNSGDAGDGGDEGEKVYRTQAEVDKAIEERLKRERRKLQTEFETKAKADAEKAAMTEAERLKAEKAEIEQRATEREKAANAKLIRAEATAQATALGIKTERIKHALKLADLDGIEVGDDGEPDSKAIKKALEAVISELPELKGGDSGASRSGGQFNGNTGKLTPEQFDKMTYEERVALYQRDPGRYNELSQTRR